MSDSPDGPAHFAGAVKLTPAHDANDYAAGQRHNLPFVNILTDDGAINENGGKFAVGGLSRPLASPYPMPQQRLRHLADPRLLCTGFGA